MIDDLKKLLDDYLKWLKDKSSLREVGNAVEITTPFLDRHNDCVQIFAKKRSDGFVLTDAGVTISELSMSGCRLDTVRRKSLLQTTLNGFGVQLVDDELLVHVTEQNFPIKKHNLIQAILAVDDMFYLASPAVESFFLEDVAKWLDEQSIRYTQHVSFNGKSGLPQTFDFLIPKSKEYPERILKIINRPNRESAKLVAFAWLDSRELRPAGSKAYAVLNDQDAALGDGVLEALHSYEVDPIVWSERQSFLTQLAS